MFPQKWLTKDIWWASKTVASQYGNQWHRSRRKWTTYSDGLIEKSMVVGFSSLILVGQYDGQVKLLSCKLYSRVEGVEKSSLERE